MLWFDEWPVAYRLGSAGGLDAIGNFLTAQSGFGWIGWVLIAFAVPLLFVKNYLRIDLRTRSWRYRRGVWPFISGSIGGFDELYGIELTKNTSLPVAQRYRASLHWQPGSIGRKSLYTSDTFSHVARPALALGERLGIPIVLAPEMAAFYAERLENIRSGVSRES